MSTSIVVVTVVAMSLYLEAANILSQKDGSLKSRIYSPKSTLKSPPAKLYALIVETLKYQELLNEIISASGLLQHEKKVRVDCHCFFFFFCPVPYHISPIEALVGRVTNQC